MTSTRRWPIVAILVVGVGLALAPAAFQMFSRVPPGGQMLDDFAPFMTDARLDGFSHDLDIIGAARDEAAGFDLDAAHDPLSSAFVEQYPAIHEDMSSMLADIRASIPNYEGVAALPPFPLFPYFFVLPGLFLAVAAIWALHTDRHGPLARPHLVVFAALGLGLIAAPIAFQMFTRAPGGGEMIDSFKPLMQRDRVTDMQGYFVVIGSGEAELRNQVVPAVAAAGGTAPASVALSEQWPGISSGMAPMIGAMADNLETFHGLTALPPFGLFPWFFLAPGVLVLVLTEVARRSSGAPATLSPSARTPEQVLEGA